MHLKSIKLAGFKSFVEPTTIPVSGDLIGIVGPNGCGKSNIIDAVRWVMGESSAKHLRGDSMADVIFNGSNSRKPVGRASVELIFDNSDGGAGGQYARYSEISIRREAGRDSQSEYFLNKTRCRRKDITGLFLGTGLGPRAYSIIEQGMVTRIIEAKPEELRGFIEEAAGISKYKERRRETENRIKHARENMERVEDIRNELGSQLQRLKRQSRAAAKYKELKQEERQCRAQLLAIRWRDLDARLQEQDAVLLRQQTTLDAALADQRAVEAEIERIRSQQTEASDKHNAVQAEFYSVGAEISRLEQAIEHARETRESLRREQEQLNQSWDEASEHMQDDLKRLDELGKRLEDGAPELAEHTKQLRDATDALHKAEQAVQTWHREWEGFSEQSMEPAKVRDIQGARIEQLEQHIRELEARQARLKEEAHTIESELQGEPADALRGRALEIDQACEELEQSLGQCEARIQETRIEREETNTELDVMRGKLQSAEARLAGLRELKAAAESRDDQALGKWLRKHDLQKAPRLAGYLSVEPGWEHAVERVLGINLAAVCVSELGKLASDAAKLKSSQLTLIDLAMKPTSSEPRTKPTLLEKIKSEADLAPLLGHVYVAESLKEAMAMRDALSADESVITRAGEWLGRNWLSLGNEHGKRGGWLEREREMEKLETHCIDLQLKADTLQLQLAEAMTQLQDLERERDELTHKLNERHRKRAEFREQLGHEQARLAQLEARRTQILREQAELSEQMNRDQGEIEVATELKRQAEALSGSHEDRRAQLQQSREKFQDELEQARTAETEARDKLHQLEIERQRLQTEFDSTRSSITRLEGQLKHLAARREELQQALADDKEPEAEFKQRLDEFLKKRLEIEERLTEARKAVADLESALREQEQERHKQEGKVQEIRDSMETEKVARQELQVRRDTQREQAQEAGFDLKQVLNELPSEAEEQAWHERLEKLIARIERLGPINLVAIEEFEEQSQRKSYIDKQYEDLSEALTTLQEAIRKIDRETRVRFKETFDRVNEGFQNFFPQLFGGGNAYLELTDNDLLETGVTVMARPPGKRNSTIHLLSGGEKALTAVAMLFAIFELNPAPFCLLDEVDAPLDDANVERYCETIKTMSQRTQLVYVTHNKITMELANVLIGVTMSEPGVSRLVAVDVEKALEMVAQ
ncbi:MAG: chromosome segregation protein SMC [Gammaproteobacteria bacterium]|nr:MAG: chromosome segregation protein SMC [Gammaproteobacteria bacterium]